MTDKKQVYCYAARYPGRKGYGMITVDRPPFAKDNAKEIAKVIREGGTIERVTIEEAKAGFVLYCEETEKQTTILDLEK